MSTAIGQPIDRVDGRAKVTGAGRYSTEIALDNMSYAVLVGAHVPSGRISVINTSEAEQAEGVLAILTHRNLRCCPRCSVTPPPGETFFPMQDDVVHYAGQPVAVVIADTLERAQHAATLLRISYEEVPSRNATRSSIRLASKAAERSGRSVLPLPAPTRCFTPPAAASTNCRSESSTSCKQEQHWHPGYASAEQWRQSGYPLLPENQTFLREKNVLAMNRATCMSH